MNAVAQAILAFLRGGPRPWQDVHKHVLKAVGYVGGGRHFTGRLDRLVRRGLIVKMLVKGRNLYLLPDALEALAGADLSDRAERQMAADLLEEQGDEDTASL